MRKTLINKANAISYLTEDHRAFTKNDCELITDLPEQAQETVFAWIRQNLLYKPGKDVHSTSYGLKHILKSDTHIYLTNNQFKDAMLVCGFEPIKETELNWTYHLKAYLRAHPLCAECERQGKLTPATEVDHIKPHRGDKQLFWDERNWQGLCHNCHSKKTATEDGGFGNTTEWL